MFLCFKLFNNVKSSHETAELGRLELTGLFGEVEPVQNVISEFLTDPLGRFADASFSDEKGGLRCRRLLYS